MKKSKIIKFIVLIVIIIAVIIVARSLNLGELLKPEIIKNWIEGFGIWGPIVFIAVYAAATALLLPGSPLSIAGGALFGSVIGTLYIIIGATIGATITFFLARLLGEEFVEKILKNKFKKVYQYNKQLETNGFSVVAFLRLVPLFPFNVLNFGLGLTKVKVRDYILATFIGIIPGTFVFAYFGNALANITIMNIVIAIVLVIVLISIFPAYKYYKRKGGKADDELLKK